MRATLLHEAGGGCASCGYDRCTANLHFHHVDPATKAFAVNMRYGRSLDAYREEAKKCVLLCANCHREHHAQLQLQREIAGEKSGEFREALQGNPERSPPNENEE